MHALGYKCFCMHLYTFCVFVCLHACSTQTKNRRLFSELLLHLLKIPTAGSSIGSLKLSGYLDALYTMARV